MSTETFDAVLAAPAHHRLVLENERVRVLETVIPAGDTTPVHEHPWQSVMRSNQGLTARSDARRVRHTVRGYSWVVHATRNSPACCSRSAWKLQKNVNVPETGIVTVTVTLYSPLGIVRSIPRLSIEKL